MRRQMASDGFLKQSTRGGSFPRAGYAFLGFSPFEE